MLSAASLACGAGQKPSPPRHDPDRSYFGLNGAKAGSDPRWDSSIVKNRLEWMKDLGVHWERTGMGWDAIEPTTGTFTFEVNDNVLRVLEENGVRGYAVCGYGAAWFKDRTAMTTDDDYAGFGRYLGRAMERYKNRVKYWSLWNEPNISVFWTPQPNPNDYAKLMKVTWETARRVSPQIKICAPVIAPLPQWDRPFVEKLYQLGCGKYFDVFDYHYYRIQPPEREVPEELAEIRAVMRRYGDDKPIFISESGVTSTDSRDTATLERQASLVARNHLVCLAAGVKRIFYFDLQNWYDNKPEVWDSQLGLVMASGAKKPSYFAYKTMVGEVDYKNILGRAEKLGPDTEGVLVHDPEKKEFILAAWLTAERAAATREFVGLSRDMKVVNRQGEAELLAFAPKPDENAATRIVKVALDMHPRYIHGVDPDTYLPGVAVQLDPPGTIIAAGETKPIRLKVNPLLKSAKAEVLSTSAPEGLVWDWKSGKVKYSGSLPEGKHQLTAMVQVEWQGARGWQKTQLERSAWVEVIPELTATIRPYLEGGKLTVDTRLINHSDRALASALTLVETREGSRRIINSVTTKPLKPAETRQIETALPDSEAKSTSAPAVWQGEFGPFRSKPFRVHAVPVCAEGPKVDGDLSDWSGIPALEICDAMQITRNAGVWSPADASAKVRLWLTTGTLFVAAEVADDDPLHNPYGPMEMYKGDALELFLGFGGPTRRVLVDRQWERQIGICPAGKDGKPAVVNFHKEKVLDGCEVKAVKNATGYLFEAAVPLEEVAPKGVTLSDGTLLGFDVALDDLDRDEWAPVGVQIGRALVWNGTGMDWHNPSHWGMCVLKNSFCRHDFPGGE